MQQLKDAAWTLVHLYSFFFSYFSQIRMFTNTFTLTPYNGSEALVGKTQFKWFKKSFEQSILFLSLLQFWLFQQKPESLDPQAKYHSLTSGLGNNYTQPRKV